MNVENHLKELGDYFKKKIIEDDFKFITCSKYTATILIDEEYTFQLWIANDPKDTFRFHGLSHHESGVFKYLDFTSQKQRLKAYSSVKKHVTIYKNTVLKREKQKQFNQLKKELNL